MTLEAIIIQLWNVSLKSKVLDLELPDHLVIIMTRILGLDLITSSRSQFTIQYAACLFDTINQEHQLIEQISTDLLLDLIQNQTIDLIAIDDANELRHAHRLMDFLADAEYPHVVQLSQHGAYQRSLSHLASEVGISLRSKPDAMKSAIICSLLAKDHGNSLRISQKNGSIVVTLEKNSQSTQNILQKKVDHNRKESTHRQSHIEITNSAYVKEIIQVIGYGKESIVYLVEDIQSRNAVIKTFRTYSSIARRLHSETYKARAAHIPLLMARDEYKFLQILNANDIPVPSPYFRDDTLVGMEGILVDDGLIAPTLAQFGREDLSLDLIQDLLYQSLDYLYDLFDEARIVHGDYSANNLLVRDGKVLVIDLSQAMRINVNTYVDTPLRLRMDKALDVVFRDLDGILTFFEREFRIEVERKRIFDEFMGLVPDVFADKVDLIESMWSGKFS